MRVYSSPSGEILHDFARAGSVSCAARLMWTKSLCIAPITSRDGASGAVRGSSVFGSARSETTSRPPRFPSSPGRVSSSSDGLDCWGIPSAGLERTVPQARSRPQPSNLRRMESLAILTLRSRQSSSLSSLCRHPAAMHSQALGILERTAQLPMRSEEHTSELQSLAYLVCRLLLEKKKNRI